MQRQLMVKMVGEFSDWLFYAGVALIKVADSAGYIVSQRKRGTKSNLTCITLGKGSFIFNFSLSGKFYFNTQ